MIADVRTEATFRYAMRINSKHNPNHAAYRNSLNYIVGLLRCSDLSPEKRATIEIEFKRRILAGETIS